MPTERQKLFIYISIAIGLVLVMIILYFLFFRGESTPDEIIETPGDTIDTATPSTPSTPTTPTVPISTEPKDELYARQTSRIFVERFNSYSNQNGNSHIDDVLPLSTPQMIDWLETQALESSNEYSGVTTVVVASRVESISETTAQVAVDVQQVIMEGSLERTEQKSGRVNLLKSGDTWKVDGWFWN